MKGDRFIINRTEKEATLLLYGSIGSPESGAKIDGDMFAKEIAYLGKEVDIINIRINSPGGSVYQGLSIVSEILRSPAWVNTYVDGIAASMAGVIAEAGDYVYMNDFAKIMTHDPAFTNQPPGTPMSKKEIKAIDAMKDTIKTVLSRRGIKPDDMGKYMESETWFNSEEALKLGLVDEVVNTKHGALNLTDTEKIAAIADKNIETFNVKNKIDMKKIIDLLIANGAKLAADSSEDMIALAVQKIIDENKEAVNTIASLNDKVKAFEDSAAAAQKTEVENMVTKAIADKRIKEEKKAEMIAIGIASIDNLKNVLEAIPTAAASLAEHLKNQGGNEGGSQGKKYTDYSKDEFTALRKSNRELADKLYADYMAQGDDAQ